MTAIERVAYLKGLYEGLNLNEDKSETKMFKAIIDSLEDLATQTNDIEDTLSIVSDQVDEIDEDLDAVESIVYDDGECSCGCEDKEGYYEVECPACHETICVDDGILEEGSVDCPNCGEPLEFEIEFDDDDDQENDEEKSAD